MYEFDTYINSIIDSLSISKKSKEEIAEEFKDHLESLKSEFIGNGFSEGESIKKAIESFGKSSDIRKKLHKSLFNFRNSGNVLFGIVITLVALIFCYLPMAGLSIAYSDYNSAVEVTPIFFYNKWYIVHTILFFIPIGYFIPIILSRVFKFFQLILIFSALGILVGVCYKIAMTNIANIGFLLLNFSLVLLGGMLGYIILNAVNKLNIVLRKERVIKS